VYVDSLTTKKEAEGDKGNKATEIKVKKGYGKSCPGHKVAGVYRERGTAKDRITGKKSIHPHGKKRERPVSDVTGRPG